MLKRGTRFRSGRTKPEAETVDHIVPKSKIWAHGSPDARWQRLNEIMVCCGCNGDKADMYPLDWLVVMPDFGVQAFADRLRRLGCPAEDIAAALEARRLATEAGRAVAETEEANAEL